MGRRVALTVLAMVTVVGVLGCGSADKGAVVTRVTQSGIVSIISNTCISGCGVSFHSPNHHYTVKQVEAVFASQGVHLHKLTKHVVPGLVQLRDGHLPRFVIVYVRSGAPGLLEFLDRRAWPRPEVTHHGNLIAFYNSDHSPAVNAALAGLH